jgi:hypothetical protein
MVTGPMPRSRRVWAYHGAVMWFAALMTALLLNNAALSQTEV